MDNAVFCTNSAIRHEFLYIYILIKTNGFDRIMFAWLMISELTTAQSLKVFVKNKQKKNVYFPMEKINEFFHSEHELLHSVHWQYKENSLLIIYITYRNMVLTGYTKNISQSLLCNWFFCWKLVFEDKLLANFWSGAWLVFNRSVVPHSGLIRKPCFSIMGGGGKSILKPYSLGNCGSGVQRVAFIFGWSAVMWHVKTKPHIPLQAW